MAGLYCSFSNGYARDLLSGVSRERKLVWSLSCTLHFDKLLYRLYDLYLFVHISACGDELLLGDKDKRMSYSRVPVCDLFASGRGDSCCTFNSNYACIGGKCIRNIKFSYDIEILS